MCECVCVCSSSWSLSASQMFTSVLVCLPELWRAVCSTLDLFSGCFWSICVASHLQIHLAVGGICCCSLNLRAVVHPHMCITQEEELVVVQSDSRQPWLLRTTSARVDPPPVRLLTSTVSSEGFMMQAVPSSNSWNLKTTFNC